MEKDLKELSIICSADEKPEVNPSYWRLYGHPLCPYVERAKLVLEHNGMRYQNVHVSLPNRPKWIFEYHTGAVPILEFPDGKWVAESLIIMEMVDDIASSVTPLYPSDPILRAQRKLFLEKFKDLGLFLFRGTLSKDEEKKRRDFKAISGLLEIIEAELKKSTTPYLFSEDCYTFVDIALLVHAERLFFFK
jgi:glutathione S-transferase